MNLFIIAPWHSMATIDVYNYLSLSAKTAGHKVYHYDLHDRIKVFAFMFEFIKNKLGDINAKNPDIKLNIEYDLYRMSTEIIDVEVHRKLYALKKELRESLDLILIITGQYITPDIVELLKDWNIPVALYATEDPYEYDLLCHQAEVYDYLFINDNINLKKYKEINPNTYYCPTACYPPIHHPYEYEEQFAFDLLFVGSGFFDRQLLLERIATDIKAMGLKFGIWGGWPYIEEGSP